MLRLVEGRTIRLFNPRRDSWRDHFIMTGGHLLIKGLTDIGKATESALAFNDPRPSGPIVVRHMAIVNGIYPPAWARGWGY